jgi:hypothetical protein
MEKQQEPDGIQPEAIRVDDLVKYGELSYLVLQTYLAYKTAQPGQEIDAPPIKFHKDTIRLHITKG